MTPAPPAKQPSPLATYVGIFLGQIFLLTPLVALGWNLGLYGAGIVDHSIDWVTALGLSLMVMVARMVVGAARATIGVIGR